MLVATHPLDDWLPNKKLEYAEPIISLATGRLYWVGNKIDEGNFGVVFECSDVFGNDLVLKALKKTPATAGTLLDRATREAQALSIARHPHTLHIYDALEMQGSNFLISERCDQTLRQFIGDPAYDTDCFFEAISARVLDGVQWIHGQGIAHCDIHAGNVFAQFKPDAIVPTEHQALTFKIGDFGLARPFTEIGSDSTFLNNICPPEIYNSNEFGIPSHLVDIYQCGLLFLNLILGKELQFSKQDLLKGAPQEIALSLEHPVADVIARMLRRHTEYRIPSAQDAWIELSSALEEGRPMGFRELTEKSW